MCQGWHIHSHIEAAWVVMDVWYRGLHHHTAEGRDALMIVWYPIYDEEFIFNLVEEFQARRAYLACRILVEVQDLWMNVLVLESEYSVMIGSIPWRLMSRLLALPGQQQPWYWPWKVNRFLSSLRKDLNYLCLLTIKDDVVENVDMFFFSTKLFTM